MSIVVSRHFISNGIELNLQHLPCNLYYKQTKQKDMKNLNISTQTMKQLIILSEQEKKNGKKNKINLVEIASKCRLKLL